MNSGAGDDAPRVEDGNFGPTICLPIDTPPEQANRETGMIYKLPEQVSNR